MRKIIYSFLLLLSLTRSSECADSDKKEKPEETKKEYTYHYWDGLEKKPREALRKITVPFNDTENVEKLKKRILANLEIYKDDVADIDIYIIPFDDEKEPKKVNSIKELTRGSTKNKLIVFRKRDDMQVMPALTTLVTLCNCKERSIQDTRILDDKTIGDVKKKFGLSDDMKLLQGSYHMGGKTVLQKRLDNTNLSDDTQLKDIMEESDKRITFFVYPKDKVPVKDKFPNGLWLWNLSKEKKHWDDTQLKSTTKENDTGIPFFADPEDKIVMKTKIKTVPQKSLVDQFKLPLFGLIGSLSLYVVHLKQQLLNASKSNRKKKKR